MEEEGRREKTRAMTVKRRAGRIVTVFKVGAEPQTKECEQLLEAGKGKKMDYLLVLSKKKTQNAALPTL